MSIAAIAAAAVFVLHVYKSGNKGGGKSNGLKVMNAFCIRGFSESSTHSLKTCCRPEMMDGAHRGRKNAR
jgi:hypothetical protein